MPLHYDGHCSVYCLNMYIPGGRLDIYDSRQYPTGKYKKDEYHNNIGPTMVSTILTLS